MITSAELATRCRRGSGEEAGTGIPMLMQHTAGSHGVQWRHLFEDERITDHFRLIAYDLPFHGKSVPPTGKAWWAERYRLTRANAMDLAVTMASVLELERPVFMGCSVGGLLALDLVRTTLTRSVPSSPSSPPSRSTSTSTRCRGSGTRR